MVKPESLFTGAMDIMEELLTEVKRLHGLDGDQLNVRQG